MKHYIYSYKKKSAAILFEVIVHLIAMVTFFDDLPDLALLEIFSYLCWGEGELHSLFQYFELHDHKSEID